MDADIMRKKADRIDVLTEETGLPWEWDPEEGELFLLGFDRTWAGPSFSRLDRTRAPDLRLVLATSGSYHQEWEGYGWEWSLQFQDPGMDHVIEWNSEEDFKTITEAAMNGVRKMHEVAEEWIALNKERLSSILEWDGVS